MKMNPSSVSPRSLRWWPAVCILALAVLVIAGIRFAEDMEGNFKNMYTVWTVMLTLVALVLWFTFLSALPWRTRWIGLGIGAVLLGCLGMGMYYTVRMDGSVSGTGLPKLTWAWTAKLDAALPALPAAPPDREAVRIDLSMVTPEDYPQFLGPEGRGVVKEAHLARDWSARPPVQLWRQPIGVGWSSFAVVGRYAVTQEQRGENELVVCYDVPTGRAQWAHANHVRFTEAQGGDGPRATPTVSEGRVYALGATGVLDCLDGATGKLVWSHDTLAENALPNLYWAKSSSPLIVDDLVLVSGGDQASGPSLLAYRKDNGEAVWRTGEDKASYASPMLATLAGKRQILMVNATSVTGHDPNDGRVLWKYDWPGDWPKCSQPVVLHGDRVFVSAGYGAGCLLLQVKPGTDGRQEVAKLWGNLNMKTQFANIVSHDGFLYGLDDGTLVCLDPATGKRKWKDGRYGHGQVLLVGDVLLVQAEPGYVALVEANPGGYRELSRLPALASKTWNHPVLSGCYLLVRNDQEAACYKLPIRSKPDSGLDALDP
jgi:outer membrane protein assembly factor BamB